MITPEQAAALDAAGLCVVPKVATPEMCRAGQDILEAGADDVWDAMIDAAPPGPHLAGVPQPHGGAARDHDIIDD